MSQSSNSLYIFALRPFRRLENADFCTMVLLASSHIPISRRYKPHFISAIYSARICHTSNRCQYLI